MEQNELAASALPDGVLPPGFLKAWGLQKQAARGPKADLNVERIVQAGIDVADAEGLGSLTMARIAKALGFTTMSLYRHVESKEELLVLMQDAAFGAPTPSTSAGWRNRCLEWAAQASARYRRHPWVLDIPISHMPSTPGQLKWLEQLLGALRETGLRAPDKLGAALMISNLVATTSRLERDLATNPMNLTDEGGDAYVRALFSVLDPKVFPEVLSVFADPEMAASTDPNYEINFALPRALDGIERLIDRV
ncbi:AcrR family transcriptional regulator [Arthrobacter pigmenti]|uniref:AcrR family transcriptional regulator n=1 Tax=Arthrobacter pigmenti TaxID=271432 RepID=A0A846RJZ4_9MICC|nr:TetR/AcrR family transcriptional regulator [Arthrobacter pigmenti]NJC20982.1 AcrR family transcriptional regulator [Arthrobacter pigmenti]